MTRESGHSAASFPRYGGIYQAILDPVVGSEIDKSRPVLVVSNDINSEYSGAVTVVLITGQPSEKVRPYEVLVPEGLGGLTTDSRIKANQIRTLDKSGLAHFRGSLPVEYLPLVERAFKIHLNMRF